jgi:aquaporin NIP
LVAELLGTFLLIFAGLTVVVGVTAVAGLAVVVIVSSLVHVSGSHLNPAISVAMAVFGCLPSAHLAPYVAAQFLGASFAATIIYDDPSDDAGAVMATVPALGALETFFVEFIVTFVLRFVITALATDPRAVSTLGPFFKHCPLLRMLTMLNQGLKNRRICQNSSKFGGFGGGRFYKK